MQVIEVIAKVESHDSVPNIEEIVAASDAVMVARGDLGALLLPASCAPSLHLALSLAPGALRCPSIAFPDLRHWRACVDSSLVPRSSRGALRSGGGAHKLALY